MKQQLPKKHGRYKIVIWYLLKQLLKRIKKRAAKRNGITWENGMSPFRKFSFSFLRDQQALTDKQIMQRFGWSNMNTPNKWYYRDLDTNKQRKSTAINKMLLN